MERATTPKRWTVSSEAGKAAGVPLALFVALAASAWHITKPTDLDQNIYDHIGANGNGAVFHVAKVISYTASPLGGMLLVVAAAALVWWNKRDVVATFATLLAPGIAAVLQRVAKDIIKRSRPPFTASLTGQTGFGFPSGHAAGIGALVTVLSLLILAKRVSVKQPSATITVLALFGILVAFTRLLVGAHYFTDAVAGLALGSAIACLVTAAIPRLDRIYRRVARRSSDASRPPDHPAVRSRANHARPLSVPGED
jgi:membrane-associated phospholipid phosphatase